MADESEYDWGADRADFAVKIIISCNVTEVLAEPEPYFCGIKRNACPRLDAYLNMFKRVASASEHFMTGSADVYEHITRQHVRDIMAAYEQYLKDPPKYTFNLTYGNEFHRILRKIALTMKSWK